MEWTRKHQNLTGTSANFVFRSSVNKAEEDLPVRQTKKQREQNREARKPREQSRLTEETSQEVHVFLFFFALTKVKLKTWEHRWGHKSIGYMLWTRQLTQVGCCFCFVVDVLVHIVVVLLFLLFVTISFFLEFFTCGIIGNMWVRWCAYDKIIYILYISYPFSRPTGRVLIGTPSRFFFDSQDR